MKTRLLNMLIAFSLFGQLSCFSNTDQLQNEKSDFKIIGFHLDLRVQVMKPEALKSIAYELSAFGVNTLIMEYEATYPFESHPLIPNKYAYTKEEIKEFIAYCNRLNIDVIPLQQTLGHMEYILRHDRYAQQRENQKDVSQICPLETEPNKALFTDLFAELVEMHPSKYIHIGGDEAYLLGKCNKCSQKVKEEGKAKLLADHLKMVCDIVVSLGKIPVMWADIANKYPDELSQLPKETVFVVWNYGWSLDRFGDPEKITKKGFEVWGAASLRSNPDNYYLTRWEYHFNNIRDFIPLCRKSDYKGMIMTSWSTSGVYSTVFEDEQRITDLIPVRHVYPISGFRMLVAAYAKAMTQKDGLDIEQFIISYCDDRYGFNKQEALQFWKAIKGMPYKVVNGKVDKHIELTVRILLDSVRQDQIILNNLVPEKNAEEFEHYRLMTDIRENYLAFENIETFVNSQEFKIDNIPEVLRQLEVILEKDNTIKARFTNMNKGLFYPEQIKEENQIRTERVKILYERLKKNRN
ncbi:MAG: beta-N-acetylhexosaminidase [Bacteroidales bacterium]|nr:beta-N-acetylhexosaminidase [Bacteroidales bacterium]